MSSSAAPTRPTLDQLVADLDQAISAEAMVAAIQGLGATHDPAALPHLIRAFGFNRPAVGDAALTAVIAFGAVAVTPLLELIDGYDYGARAYSVRALARIGDPQACSFLLEAIQSDFAPSVRRAAVRGLGGIVAQMQADDQHQALQVLHRCLADPDWGIRYAAVCALADLHPKADVSVQVSLQTAIQTALQDRDPLIRVKAQVSCAGDPPR